MISEGAFQPFYDSVMCVKQAHQSQEIKFTADGRHAFVGPVHFGDQRSCLVIGYSFLEGNDSVLNMMI